MKYFTLFTVRSILDQDGVTRFVIINKHTKEQLYKDLTYNYTICWLDSVYPWLCRVAFKQDDKFLFNYLNLKTGKYLLTEHLQWCGKFSKSGYAAIVPQDTVFHNLIDQYGNLVLKQERLSVTYDGDRGFYLDGIKLKNSDLINNSE